MIQTVLLSVLAAIMYAGVIYLKKHTGANAEVFDSVKFLSTVVIGALVGIMVGVTGVIPTETMVLEQIASMAGIIVVVENVVKMVLNKLGWM